MYLHSFVLYMYSFVCFVFYLYSFVLRLFFSFALSNLGGPRAARAVFGVGVGCLERYGGSAYTLFCVKFSSSFKIWWYRYTKLKEF